MAASTRVKTTKTRDEDEKPTKSTRSRQEPHNVRDETHVPNEPETRSATKDEKEFIDNEPGYSAEQLDQMSEYYGTKKNVQTSGDIAEIRTTGRVGDES